MSPHPVVVVGAGPAGLATSQQLGERGVAHLVLEQGDGPGHCWANAYDSLKLHTGKLMSSLPGLAFPRSYPTFVPRQRFWEYLSRYAERFRLPVETRCRVTAVRRDDGHWVVDSNRGALRARVVVMATGIMSNPQRPRLPGEARFRGRVTHSVEYRRPAPYAGRRVLVVGVGNSGAEIAAELGRAGVETTIAVRSGANVVPLTMFGLPIQYLAYWVRKLPRPAQNAIVAAVGRATELRRGPPILPRPGHGPLEAIPVIGFHLVDAIRAGLVRLRPGIAELTEDGARFRDGAFGRFDDIILATGFAPALHALGDLVRRDAKGFALRTDRVTSADQPGLYFVGHNYDATGGLWNIRRDATLVARMLG
ncbi:MAG TPA: NAD(P)/FAD-dependent oxidoreductase [Gemmatimonadales bacterium]|nr:NAD(P)/FAD-dependent oxidoreductase [Gemmatimonadales bacterium]